MRIELWDHKEPFRLADGKSRTIGEIAKEFPFVEAENVPVVLEFFPNGNVCAVDDLGILRQVYNIDYDLSDQEALERYIEIRENPPAPMAEENDRLNALEQENELLKGCIMQLADEIYGGVE